MFLIFSKNLHLHFSKNEVVTEISLTSINLNSVWVTHFRDVLLRQSRTTARSNRLELRFLRLKSWNLSRFASNAPFGICHGKTTKKRRTYHWRMEGT